MNKIFSTAIAVTCLTMSAINMPVWAGPDAHHHESDEQKNITLKKVNNTVIDHDQQHIELTQQQINNANIVSQSVADLNYQPSTYAPAEIKVNGYSSYVVSPRVDSVVISRHVSLGEQVKQGQALVTLFSEKIAQAQANYQIASAEWQRIQGLTAKTVSQKERLESKTNFHAALATLKAFALSDTEIAKLTQSQQQNLGQYTLYSAQRGIVLKDHFQQGQRVEAGTALLLLADEKTLWVEAQLPASSELVIRAGTTAKLVVNQKHYQAKVIQDGHTINNTTRTRIVRLEVNNSDHQLHAGLFADVYFPINYQGTLLPQTALMQEDSGKWHVFVQKHSGEFEKHPVVLGERFGQYQQVSGLASTAKVVISGAFFLASELAKSSFDIHNH